MRNFIFFVLYFVVVRATFWMHINNKILDLTIQTFIQLITSYGIRLNYKFKHYICKCPYYITRVFFPIYKLLDKRTPKVKTFQDCESQRREFEPSQGVINSFVENICVKQSFTSPLVHIPRFTPLDSLRGIFCTTSAHPAIYSSKYNMRCQILGTLGVGVPSLIYN